jgi:spermidine synthase
MKVKIAMIDGQVQTGSLVRTLTVYVIFTVSGGTALVYQVIWARWLGLVFGNTTVSVSIVLASFMLGLALGSHLAGRLLPRVGNPMRGYAWMELGIGVFAVCFPLISRLTDSAFSLLVTAESSALSGLLVRTVLVFLLLLLPTTLMGATLPLLTEFFRRSPRHTSSWKVGLLYAANTLGAALGTMAVGFVLIELLGVLSTTLIAASLNLFIAVLAFRFARSAGLLPAGEPRPDERTLDGMGKLAVGVLTASGAIALASEVLWTRTMETLIGNSTYAFATIVLMYLLGIACGSWFMSLVVNRLKAPTFWLISLLAGMGFWCFAAIFLLKLVMAGLATSRLAPALVPLSEILWNYLRTTSLILPLALLSGACFPLATRIIDPKSEDARGSLIARAYAWNTAGAVAGSLLAGFVIAPLSDYFDSLYVLAILYFLAASTAYASILLARWAVLVSKLAVVSLGVLSLVLVGASIVEISQESFFVTQFNSRSRHGQRVVFHKPGIQGVTSVLKNPASPMRDSLLVNGKGMTVKVTDTKMMAHFPMLFHPDPEDTLVIAFGMGTSLPIRKGG